MAQDWVTLDAEDVLGAMTKRERDDFATTSVDVAVPDRIAPILSDLVAEIRGHVATWSQNTLSADASKIPPAFRARALAIARWRVLITIPGYNPGEPRKAEWEAAEKFFQQVAAGKIRPEAATDAVPSAVPSENPAGVQFSAPGSRTGRQRMNGL